MKDRWDNREHIDLEPMKCVKFADCKVTNRLTLELLAILEWHPSGEAPRKWLGIRSPEDRTYEGHRSGGKEAQRARPLVAAALKASDHDITLNDRFRRDENKNT